MKIRRVRSKIILSFCILMVSVGAIAMLLVSGNLNKSLTVLNHDHGIALTQILAGQVAEPLSYNDLLETRRLILHAKSFSPNVAYVFVTSRDGKVIAHSFPSGEFPADLLAIAQRNGTSTLSTELGTISDIPAPLPNGTLGNVHVGMSMAAVERATLQTMRNITYAIVVAMGSGVVLILVLASLISRPFYRLMDSARRLGEGELNVVAPVSGEDELASLARTFNRMAEQIRERIAEAEGLHAYLERVLDHMGPGIVVVSADGSVEYANETIRQQYGDIVGLPCRQTFGCERPCHECSVEEVLETGSVVRRAHTSPSGRSYEMTYVPFLSRHGKVSVIETVVDVTEQRAMVERLQKAERLAVAGEIAAGVVHTVNNPLDGIRRALSLAARNPHDLERTAAMLAMAQEGTERIAKVTQTLLSFARLHQAPTITDVPMNAVVEEVMHLVRLKASANQVKISLELDPALPTVRGDRQGLNEVAMNLLINAIDATPPQGEITVTTRVVDAAAIEVAVSNTGQGVPPELRDRIFEPGVSTKEVGRGTGLGLSVVRRIVDVHNGQVTAESVPGKGATFRVCLPIAPPAHLEGA